MSSSQKPSAVPRILVVEDDRAIRRGLTDNLEYESYEVLTASDGAAGYRMLREEKPDLVILDLMLPGMTGYELCRRARQEGITTPILMLTARGEEIDRVMGLDLGADDYVTKPFSIAELLARVRAILRRAAPGDPLPDEIQFADVKVDFRSYEAQKGGKTIRMARKEFGLLRLLAARLGEVVSRDELLNEVWGYDACPSTRTVDNHIMKLRKKLEHDPTNPGFILSIYGQGYKFIG